LIDITRAAVCLFNMTECEPEPTIFKSPAPQFRDYFNHRHEIVFKHYEGMRINQTLDYSRRMYAKHHSFDHCKLTIWEALDKMDLFVDGSDPDIDMPNKIHMMQTAMCMRNKGEPDWMQLIGMIHDLGKIIFMWGEYDDGQHASSQWGIAGDTWVVGHPIPECVVFPELNKLNQDEQHPVYGKGNGMYELNCGISALEFAYGHDEYLYHMIQYNQTQFEKNGIQYTPLPPEALAMIRYHSCYPLHSGKAYEHLYASGDSNLIKEVCHFNQYDLYTKADDVPDYETTKALLSDTVNKYLPGVLFW